MAVINRAKFKRNLQLGLNTNFGLEYNRYAEEYKAAYDINTSVKAYEEDVLNVGFGAAPVKSEGANVHYDTGAEGWTARYQHETIALAFAITEEAEEDGLYGSLGAKYAKALARSMQHTKEIKGAATFNNGFSTSFTGGDAKPLFATDHPLYGGGTGSNTLATPADISEPALEDALTQITLYTDDRGIPVVVDAQTLIIPMNLQFVAPKILQTPTTPFSVDNTKNIVADGWFPGGIKKMRRLTDTDAWFIKTDCPDGLKMFQRVKITRKVQGDFETGNMKYRARERYSFGWTDWRGAFGSPGA